MYRVLRRKHHITHLPSDNVTREGLHCPWIDETEWKAVCSWLHGDTASERRKGVERVMAWRARGVIPFPVESTADIVECLLRQDTNGSSYNNGSLMAATHESNSLMLAMLITRFVNGVYDYGCSHNTSIDKKTIHDVVTQFGVPLWLVTLRHDSTHRVLPPLTLLTKGIQFIQQWLWTNYWQPQYSMLPVSDTTGLVQKIPSIWHDSSPTDSSSPMNDKNSSDEHLESLKFNLKRYLTLSLSDRKQAVKKLYKLLANSDYKVFLELLRNGLFLSTQDNVPQLFDGKLSLFPLLSSSIVSQWEPLLRSMGRYRSTAKTQLIHALIIACNDEREHVTSQQQVVVTAGWLGLLLQSTRGTTAHDNRSNNTYIEVDITEDTGLMAGDIQCETLLRISKDYPGPYTWVINERLVQLLPHDPKLNYEKLLHFSVLLSISEGISPSLRSVPLMAREEGKHMKTLNDFKLKLSNKRNPPPLITDNNMEIGGEEDSSTIVWKKDHSVSCMDWYNTPLGCLPGQQLTPLSLDLPEIGGEGEREKEQTIHQPLIVPTSLNFSSTDTQPRNNSVSLINSVSPINSEVAMETSVEPEGEREEGIDDSTMYLQLLRQAIVLY